ncbi:MAG: thioredoxin family protein [Thermodesulfobacteriota bacterium]
MRTIEVFTAGCPICKETLDMVRDVTRDCGCEVIERRCEGERCCPEATGYGIKAIPTIVVDGVIAYEGKPSLRWAETMLKQ